MAIEAATKSHRREEPDHRPRAPRRTRKKLTIDMDPDKHRKFKAWCAAHGVTMVEHLVGRIDEVV